VFEKLFDLFTVLPLFFLVACLSFPKHQINETQEEREIETNLGGGGWGRQLRALKR